MVQNIINVDERLDRILNIVKAQHGLKNKSQAVELVLKIHADTFLEPELRPEFVDRLKKIQQGNYSKTFSSIGELRKHIESK